MLGPYVCVAGMAAISLVLYALESVNPEVCAFLVYLFAAFSLYERGWRLGVQY
jgi:hypothetical protein